MPFEKRNPPKEGDPIYVVVRYGKCLLNPSGTVRTFYSPEHFAEHKKRYNMNFLPDDKLVKYVPEIVEGE